MIEGIKILAPFLWIRIPIETAIGIWMMHGKIAAGYILKTEAITSPKIASTMVSAIKRIDRKRIRVRGAKMRPAMSPTVCPLFRIETTSEPKS